MKVRCLANTGRALPSQLRNKWTNIETTTEFGITIGKEYVVYALGIYNGFVAYSVCDEEWGQFYPVARYCPLFEILDGRPSLYWEFRYSITRSPFDSSFVEHNQLFAFKEFHEEGFYQRLVDGELRELEVFRRYKRWMDEEYPDPPDPKVAETATALEDDWLQCPVCADAWRSKSVHGMVDCPSCGARVRNPRYNPARRADRPR